MEAETLLENARATTPSLLPPDEKAATIERDAKSFPANMPTEYVLTVAKDVWHYSKDDALEVAMAFNRLEVARSNAKFKKLRFWSRLAAFAEAIGWMVVGGVIHSLFM